MKNQVLSIEQMNRLKEFGLNVRDGSMMWYDYFDHNEYGTIMESEGESEYPEGKKYKNHYTYTLQDILRHLPVYIHGKEYKLGIEPAFGENEKWCIGYHEQDEDRHFMEGACYVVTINDLITGAYKLLCWCLENGYIKTKSK